MMQSERTNPNFALGFTLFIGVVFALTCLLVLTPGQAASDVVKLMTFAFAMLIPALTAIPIQKFVLKRPILGEAGLKLALGSLRNTALAYLGMIILLGLIYSVSFLLFPQLFGWNSEIFETIDGTFLDIGSEALTLTSLLVFALTIGTLTNILMYLGEEIGWRGFMTPILEHWFGRAALIIGGVIWAVWHTPMIYLRHNYAGQFWLGHALWIPIVICLSVIFQWAQWKSGNVFAPAIMHGAVNQTAGIITMLAFSQQVFNPVIHGLTGIVGLVILAPVAVVLYFTYPLEGNPA